MPESGIVPDFDSENTMDSDSKTKPPYVAYTTFRNFLGSLKAGAIPSRIDRSLMVGMSGSSQGFLMHALRYLGLIDSTDAPTDALESLVNSDGADRKEKWKEIFAKAYGPMLENLDLTRATSAMLNEKFLAQGVAGETARKAYSFFTAGAQEAEIAVADSLKSKVRTGGGGTRRSRKKTNGKASPAGEPGDEFAQDDSTPSNPLSPKPATLLLDGKGERVVKLLAPATVTKAELNRIQQWLKFQLIVEDK